MSGPIVYVDRSEIATGRVDELRSRVRELAEFVEANEPGIVAYNVYFSADGTEMSVIHVHRDAASLATHFRIAGPAFRPFVELLRLKTIDVYGDVTDELLDELRAKAGLLGDGSVFVHSLAAGFARIEPSVAAG